MPYQANVTDTAYHYDGSFPGFLCCIFESFSRREIPAAVCPPQEAQMTLFGVREIVTDLSHARRVAAGLDRLGPVIRGPPHHGISLHRSGQGPEAAALCPALL